MNAFKFYYNSKGEIIVERCTSLGIYSSKWEDKWPAPDTFTRSLDCEKLAEDITLQ